MSGCAFLGDQAILTAPNISEVNMLVGEGPLGVKSWQGGNTNQRDILIDSSRHHASGEQELEKKYLILNNTSIEKAD